MITITGDIVLCDRVMSHGSIVVDDKGDIAQIDETLRSPRRSGDIDAQGCLIWPGFIDMHIHGGGGADFMKGQPDAIRRVLSTHARYGATGLLATTLTAARENIEKAILAIVQVHSEERSRDQARLLGIHIEGPYICMAKRGAQSAAHVRLPDTDEFAHWLELAGGLIREITIAPELPGAEALIRMAVDREVVVSIGHTNSTAEQVIEAVRWGARQSTHTFNAMSGVHHRDPGTVVGVLVCEQIRAELIADGVHVHPLVCKLVAAAKGSRGVILITDAMSGTSMPDGQYGIGDHAVTVCRGVASLPDGTLAGSVLTMNRAVANIRQFAGVSPVEAAWMASTNAAAQLGIADRYGSLEVGKAADIVITDPNTGDVIRTIIGGDVAYER